MDNLTNNDHLRQGFVRQRRNLMTISFVLFFLLYGNIEIPTLNILGNEIVFGEEDKLKNMLLILWGYFYYRYYVYFRDLKDSGYSNVFYAHLQSSVKEKILNYAKDIPNISQMVNIYDNNDKYWTGKVRLDKVDSYTEQKETENIRIEGWTFFRSKFKAHIATLLHTRYFTEYALPFFVGLTPVFALVYQCYLNL